MNNPVLTQQVLSKIQNLFEPETHESVIWALSQYGLESYEREVERVQLAVLELAQHDLNKVLDYVDAAKKDYRDILFWHDNPEEPL